MKKILHVAELGVPVLRQKAKKVSNISARETQELIDCMILTMQEYTGAGLAAPQVYEDQQIFIMQSRPISGKKQELPPTAVINPRIIKKSKAKKKDWEGCLSIPGIRALVPRHVSITVQYTDRTGKLVKRTFKNFLARVFQHEFDHLQGIVYLDRVKGTDIVTEKEMKKMIGR